ncbi:archaeosortase/exosortase family protein [Phenylobacterium deserti]|nr:archaeosortase/exosortase family protein [Phenylobacterium deserti]
MDRREILLWALAAAAISFLVRNYFRMEGAERFAIFDSLAFAAAAMRLARCAPVAARPADIGAAFAAAALAALGPNHAAGAALTLLSLTVLTSRDVNARAAGAVMLALAVHQLWSKILFAAVGPEIVKVDATLVGWATQLFVPGATWTGNIITTSPTFSIVVEEGCSSFSNVSLALLCYMSVSRLERPEWRQGDLWVIGATCAVQILLNVARIFAMAQSYPLFQFWHDGAGAGIYAAAAAACAVLISAVGTRLVGRT